MTVTLYTTEEIDRALRQIRRRLDSLEAGQMPLPSPYAHRRYVLIDHSKVSI